MLIAAIILALCALRLIHLEADMPPDLTRNVESGQLSVGLYVDEGYKTLDARNMYLYGHPKWNPDDQFHGWWKRSPLTQWAFYLSFRLFGQSLSSARIVTLAWFFVLLLGYALGAVKKYSTGLLVLGLVLLGLSYHLFLFSRLAIFAIPLATSLCCLLFFLGREGMSERPVPVVLALAIASTLATFGIKHSAPLYFLPILFGLVLAVFYGRPRPRSVTIAIITAVALTGGITLAATHAIWWTRIQYLSPRAAIASILDNGLSSSSGFLVCVGLLCAFHVMLTRSVSILGNPYGAGLVALVLLGPVLVSFFPYHPLRYYIPLLPAFPLLALEWFHVRAWRESIPQRSSWFTTLICLIILVAAILNLARAINQQVLSHIPLMLGSEPGLSASAMYRVVVPVAAALAIGLWLARHRMFEDRVVLGVVVILLAISTARDLYMNGRFLLNPSYRSRGIAADIRRIVPPGSSIGGDWAPFFTLGSEIKALYLNERFNRGESVRLVRPDYYLFSDTGQSEEVRGELERLEGVTVGPAIYRARYAERDMALLPLTYRD